MLYNICHVMLFHTCHVMLYNICHVMLFHTCHVMLYNICHVMLNDICSEQNRTEQNMLYNMRHVI